MKGKTHLHRLCALALVIMGAAAVHSEEFAAAATEPKTVTYGQVSAPAPAPAATGGATTLWPEAAVAPPIARPARPALPSSRPVTVPARPRAVEPTRPAAPLPRAEPLPTVARPTAAETARPAAAVPATPRTQAAGPGEVASTPVAPSPAASAVSPASAVPAAPPLAAAATAATPEAIPPRASTSSDPAVAPEEAASPTPVAPAFVSRRQTLGEPTSLVPTLPSPDAVAAGESPRLSGTGSWYKLVAGALFLASLGFIGMKYRHRGRDIHESASDEPAASWAPPLDPRAIRRQNRVFSTKQVEPSVEGLTAAPAMESLWEQEPIARDPVRRRRRGAAPAGSGGAFVFESVPTGRQEPEFHSEIERRVRRRAALQRETEVDEPVTSPRRARRRDDEYALVSQLASQGVRTEEISRRLSIPVDEVRTVVNVRGSEPGAH